MGHDTTSEKQAEQYVRKIRNAAKRDYARLYMAYLLGTRRDAPLAGAFPLSYMGAQDVRLHLAALLGNR